MCYYCSCTPTVNLHSIASGTLVFPLLTSSPFALQSRDQGLDVEPSTAGGPRSLYSSLSTLGPSQYPTLPLGASTASGMWSPPYPTLARSPSAGDQSDSVFLESPEDPSLPPGSPDRYCRDPTYSNDSQGDLETDGPSGFQPTHHLHHSLPRQSRGCNQIRILPGEPDNDSTFIFPTISKCLICFSNSPSFVVLHRVCEPGDSGSQAGDFGTTNHTAS